MSSTANYKRLIIITGASRGIGAGLAIECNRKYSDGTLFLLIARNKDKLEEVKKKLNEDNSNKSNDYRLLTIDFSNRILNSNDYKSQLQGLLCDVNLSQIEELMVFYNHGTLSILTIEESSGTVDQFYQINVIGVWNFLTAILQLLPFDLIKRQFHINTSTKCVEMSNPRISLYASSRTARAKLFECLASEKTDFRVLSYQPGPVYTDMLEQTYKAEALGKEFNDNYEKGLFLTPEQTCKKLLKIIEDNTFKSGSAIDFYDYN